VGGEAGGGSCRLPGHPALRDLAHEGLGGGVASHVAAADDHAVESFRQQVDGGWPAGTSPLASRRRGASGAEELGLLALEFLCRDDSLVAQAGELG